MSYKKQVWDYEEVEEYLQIAAKVDKSLPKVVSKGYGTSSFVYIRTEAELFWNDKEPARFKPTGEQVSIWEDVVLRWFSFIEAGEDKKIVWLRSCGMGWSRLGKKFSLTRQTVATRYKKAIKDIVFQLNKD
ncbi:MAG: DUF6362 family protein [Alphaproteobacteria bacterium]